MMPNTIDYSKCKDPVEFTPSYDGETPDWFDKDNPIEVRYLELSPIAEAWTMCIPGWFKEVFYRPADPEILVEMETAKENNTPTPEQIREYVGKLTPEQRKEAGIVLEEPMTNRERFEAFRDSAWPVGEGFFGARGGADRTYNWLKEQGALKEGWE